MNTGSTSNEAEADALAYWQGGLFCAESVAVALARRQHVDTSLLPAIASGFCGGMGHTRGPCGAMTGAVIGLGLAFGRSGPGDSTDRVYRAVASLVEQFTKEFGSTACAELVGCDLATEEGQRKFREDGLRERCAVFTRRAAQMASDLIDSGKGESETGAD